jgi:glutamate formiminotransferase
MAKLVECIPNFSISKEKDEAGYDALVETAQSVPGCSLLHIQSDGNHNRCVLTLLGSPEGIEEAAFRLTQKAAQVIDLNKHRGEHLRMGATDVIPLVPMGDATIAECVAMSKRLGQRIWEQLQIPSFLYEESATRPERRDLAACRRGQFEGMPEKLLRPEWAPDFGERKIHPTAGITAIGTRMPLVAFNVNLATSDVEIAKKIAKTIRGSSGGFRCCKAMGFLLEDRGIAQVSMNMVNCEVTPLPVVYEQIRALAERYGTSIVGSELVGMSPAKALLDCAEYYLKLENFDCYDQVLEYQLLNVKKEDNHHGTV